MQAANPRTVLVLLADRGFERVALGPGETKTVRMVVPVATLAYWSDTAGRFVTEEDTIRDGRQFVGEHAGECDR